jgi:hypothetical protein
MTEHGTAGATTPGGLFEDILEVLWAPATVFERSRHRGAGLYMVALTLIAIALIAATRSLIQPYVDANFDLQVSKLAAQGRAMPPEAVASGRTFGGYFLFAGWALSPVFSGLIGGVLVWLGAKVATAPLPLGRAVFIATLAGVPRVLGILATAIQGAVLDTGTVQSLFAASLGPARFVDPATTNDVVLTLLAGFDVFGIWNLAITAVGVSVVARVSRGAGWIAAIVGLAISLLFSLIPAALT